MFLKKTRNFTSVLGLFHDEMVSFSDLPLEVLHFIITFLTKNDYGPILKFRTVCKYWKEIGENSLVWLECQLYIYPPPTYLTLIHAWRERSVTISISIVLHEEISIIRKIIGQVLVVPEEEEDHMFDQQRSPILLTEENRFERANYISHHFLIKYRFYHQSWEQFVLFHQWLNGIRVYNKVWIESSILEITCVVNILILSIGAYLLSSISNYPTSLSLTEILGFCCLHWNIGFYLMNWIFYFIGCFGRDVSWDDEINILRPYTIFIKAAYTDEFIVLLYLCALFATFLLLQCSLSAENSSVKYSYIILPFFCSTIIAIITLLGIGSYVRIVEVIGHVSLCSIFISVFVIGLYYDGSSLSGISSVGYAFIPLFPLELFLLGTSVLYISQTLSFWAGVFRGEAIVSSPLTGGRDQYRVCRIGLRLLANLAPAASVCFVFLLLLNMIYEAFKEKLSLATSLVSVIMIIIFVQIGVIGQKHDNVHLH